MSDAHIFHTADGGEIEIAHGVVRTSSGLYSAVYLSLFGGNEEDSGGDGDSAQWWGNLTERPARRYRSETQHLLRSLPAIPANLVRVAQAAERDLAWMVETQFANLVSAKVTMPARNRVAFGINVEIGDDRYAVALNEYWGTSAS